MAARLGKQLKAGGFRTFRHYYDRVKADASGELLIGLIDALTTNHTGFLREPAHSTTFVSSSVPSIGIGRDLTFGRPQAQQAKSRIRCSSAPWQHRTAGPQST